MLRRAGGFVMKNSFLFCLTAFVMFGFAVSEASAQKTMAEMVYNQGFSTGIDLVFLKPRYDDNLAFSMLNTNEDFSTDAYGRNFSYNPEISPRVWISKEGYTGFSLRARYWTYDHDADAESAAVGGLTTLVASLPTDTATGGLALQAQGETLSADSFTKAYTVDLELGQRVNFECWQMKAGGGFRHGSVEHGYDARAYRSGETLIGASSIRNRFDGVGPTIFVEAKRPLGFSNLALFANARYSILLGSFQVRQTDTITVSDTYSEDVDSTVRIGEVQLGVEWERLFVSGNRLYFTAAWELQAWEGAGSIAGKGTDMGLSGFVLSAGLDF